MFLKLTKPDGRKTAVYVVAQSINGFLDPDGDYGSTVVLLSGSQPVTVVESPEQVMLAMASAFYKPLNQIIEGHIGRRLTRQELQGIDPHEANLTPPTDEQITEALKGVHGETNEAITETIDGLESAVREIGETVESLPPKFPRMESTDKLDAAIDSLDLPPGQVPVYAVGVDLASGESVAAAVDVEKGTLRIVDQFVDTNEMIKPDSAGESSASQGPTLADATEDAVKLLKSILIIRSHPTIRSQHGGGSR